MIPAISFNALILILNIIYITITTATTVGDVHLADVARSRSANMLHTPTNMVKTQSCTPTNHKQTGILLKLLVFIFTINSNSEINLTQAVSILKYSHIHSKSRKYATYYQVASTCINHVQIQWYMSKLPNRHIFNGN